MIRADCAPKQDWMRVTRGPLLMSDLSARRAEHASYPLVAAKQDTVRKNDARTRASSPSASQPLTVKPGECKPFWESGFAATWSAPRFTQRAEVSQDQPPAPV